MVPITREVIYDIQNQHARVFQIYPGFFSLIVSVSWSHPPKYVILSAVFRSEAEEDGVEGSLDGEPKG
jgi:hypothetical protein